MSLRPGMVFYKDHESTKAGLPKDFKMIMILGDD